MRIIKPHGHTKVVKTQNCGQTFERQYTDKNTDLAIIDFSEKSDKLLIAYWISTIDKIIRKQKYACETTKNIREKLGKACFESYIENELKDEKLVELWQQKLDPFKNNSSKNKSEKQANQKKTKTKKTRSAQIKGRWYASFYGDKDPENLQEEDHKQCAEKYTNISMNNS